MEVIFCTWDGIDDTKAIKYYDFSISHFPFPHLPRINEKIKLLDFIPLLSNPDEALKMQEMVSDSFFVVQTIYYTFCDDFNKKVRPLILIDILNEYLHDINNFDEPITDFENETPAKYKLHLKSLNTEIKISKGNEAVIKKWMTLAKGDKILLKKMHLNVNTQLQIGDITTVHANWNKDKKNIDGDPNGMYIAFKIKNKSGKGTHFIDCEIANGFLTSSWDFDVV